MRYMLGVMGNPRDIYNYIYHYDSQINDTISDFV